MNILVRRQRQIGIRDSKCQLFDRVSYMARAERFVKLNYEGLQCDVHGKVIYQ